MMAVAAERLVRRFRPLQVILFGSHARGDAGPHSDVDILVVMERCPDRVQAAAGMLRELSDAPFPKDVVVATPEDLGETGALEGAVFGGALREGIVLYSRQDARAKLPTRPRPGGSPGGNPSPVTPARIADALGRIVRHSRPLKVMLLGPHARGEASHYADVVFLVVLERCDNALQATVDLLRELRGIGFAKRVIVITAEEMDRRGNVPGAPLQSALRDGKLLYERP